MIPFIDPGMIARHHAHIVAYAELLAQWCLFKKSAEVWNSVPSLQRSRIEPKGDSRDTGPILSVERSCIQCAATSDGQRPFGTCSHNHNWSSSMKCTVCRLPARGRSLFECADLTVLISHMLRSHEAMPAVYARHTHGLLDTSASEPQNMSLGVWLLVQFDPTWV